MDVKDEDSWKWTTGGLTVKKEEVSKDEERMQ